MGDVRQPRSATGDPVQGQDLPLRQLPPRNDVAVDHRRRRSRRSGCPYGTYEWAVQCRDDRGIEGHSTTTAGPSPSTPRRSRSIPTRIQFLPNANNEIIGITACTEGAAGLNIGLGVRVNDANDGSTSGNWIIIKQLGVPCFDQTPGNPDHPEWHTLPFKDGTHVVRIEAFKTTLPSEDPNWLHDVDRSAVHVAASAAGLAGAGGCRRTAASRTAATSLSAGARPSTRRRTGLRASLNADPSVSPVLDQTLDPATLTASTANGESRPTPARYPRRRLPAPVLVRHGRQRPRRDRVRPAPRSAWTASFPTSQVNTAGRAERPGRLPGALDLA